jgi:signal transduction histidine kinase
MVVDEDDTKTRHDPNGSPCNVTVVADTPAVSRLPTLIEAAAAVVAEGDVEALLSRLVREARAATGASYAALGVLGSHGVLSDFVYDGVGEDQARAIGHLPTGRGVLGTVIRERRTLVLDVIQDHPDSYGFPPNHPGMTTFLGVPVGVGDRVFGNLYLTDKEGGFTEEDVMLVEALSRIAGAAVQTGRLQARLRSVAIVEERQRIARDLHDSVIQDLFAVGLGLQALATRVDEAGAAQLLDDSVDRLDQSVNTLRNYIFELADTSHAPIPLGERLQELVSRMGSAYPARVRLTVENAVATPGPDDDGILMLATEALSNALRHAEADNVQILLAHGDASTRLEVEDDGIGFDSDGGGPGMGLANMRARAEMLGGELLVESVPGTGTRVVLDLPTRPAPAK